jgi:aspartyl-tRNA(Asn)/glutamyl-tRNA(Gln) amidotransferase subunit C
MKISHDEIKHVAQLARLELSPAEVESMAEHLDRILGYVDKLSEIDTEGVKPTTHALSICNAFREDIVTESLPREEALKNGPRQNGEAFVVPKVI